MPVSQRRRFARDHAQLARSVREAKLMACPHCGCVGTLNRHGVLMGYAEAGQDRIVRGQRLYCSNRHRRPGCGRTFSILLSGLIAGFTVSAETLGKLLEAVATGVCCKVAWERVRPAGWSLRSGYRLVRRLDRAQAGLRAWLCRHCAPPACASNRPLAQLLAHLRAAVTTPACVLSSFQSEFDRPVLD